MLSLFLLVQVFQQYTLWSWLSLCSVGAYQPWNHTTEADVSACVFVCMLKSTMRTDTITPYTWMREKRCILRLTNTDYLSIPVIKANRQIRNFQRNVKFSFSTHYHECILFTRFRLLHPFSYIPYSFFVVRLIA